MEHAQIEGIDIAFDRRGAGPQLVLLHGFIADSRIFRQQLVSLAEDFELIALDLPGCGESDDPPESYRMAEYARWLAVFMDAVGVERAHILGQSWGGVLAQEFYRLHPERVHSLILVNTYAGWTGSFGADVAHARLESCLQQSRLSAEEWIPGWMPDLFASEAPAGLRDEMIAIMSDFHPSGFRTMTKALAEVDTRDLLPDIHVPVLLIWGVDDSRSPVDAVARPIADAIPGASLTIIPDPGHMSPMEQPALFNTAVRTFLQENHD